MRNHAYRTKKWASAFAAIAIGGATFAAAPAAHSQIYRWVDAEGSATYSNKPPTEPASAREVTVIPDIPGTISTPPEKRAPEAARPSGAAAVQHAPAPRAGTPDVLDAFNRAATSADAPPASSQSASPSPSTSPHIVVAPGAPEAVRDPCLRSADPKCHERNRAAYVPYRGYSPSAAGAVGVGATSASAGGTLAGGSPPPAPGKITPPKASTYALPPGSEPLPAARAPR
jgi:hypothetical protein